MWVMATEMTAVIMGTTITTRITGPYVVQKSLVSRDEAFLLGEEFCAADRM
jgi:hypothetical protein